MSAEPYTEIATSPNGRYVRYDEKLGEGSSKKVWKAFDKETGRVVAWNVLSYKPNDPDDEQKVKTEISILKSLSHPNLLRLEDFWQDKERHRLYFITEIMTDGTLRDYMIRVGQVNLCVIKNWCRQILSALYYLHSRSPAIIHRDLKCDNIFIDGASGILRIGDFGSSAQKDSSFLTTMLGTPEFMAPEIFQEQYTEKVDIYAFGMCLLEMVTGKYPYEECNAQPHKIYKLVTDGILPESLKLIEDNEVSEIIRMCLKSDTQRPSAKTLLETSFFHALDVNDNNPVGLNLNASTVTVLEEIKPIVITTVSVINPPEVVSPAKIRRKSEAELIEDRILSHWL